MRLRALMITAVLAPALAACAFPNARTPDLTLPAAYAPQGAPATGPLLVANLETWWTAFGDPDLEKLIADALAHAPDARTALSQLDQARATRSANFYQAVLPGGALQGNAQKSHSDQLSGNNPFSFAGDSEQYSGSFNVSWEIDVWGRRKAALKVLNGQFAYARFAYEAARWSLAANVAQSYFQARGLAIQLDDARQTQRIDQQLYDLADRRAKAGLGASSDADQAAGQLSQAKAQADGLEAQLLAARRTLLVLVGRGTDPLDSLPTPTTLTKAPAAPATLPGDLLARRPDVREAAANVESASGTLRYDQLAIFPTFTLTPGVSLSKSVQPNYNSEIGTWSLGLGVSLPVLDQPRIHYQAKAQQAVTEQAVIAYEKAVQTAYGEADSALIELASDQRRVTELTDGEHRAALAYDAARRRYAMGLADLSAALQAEQTWRGARTALTGAQIQALERAVQTYKALGGGWSPQQLASADGKTR